MPPTNVNGNIVERDMNLYWKRKEAELWVYDTRGEAGINVHVLDQGATGLVRTGLNMRFVRTSLYWRQVDLGPGQFGGSLAYYDQIVSSAQAAGVELVFVVTQEGPSAMPPGVNYQSDANKAAAYQRYADCLAFLAARYGPGSAYGTVRFWELFNEWEGPAFTGLFGSLEGVVSLQRGRYYAQMLARAYPAIKAANPAAWVVVGGIGGGTVDSQVIDGVYSGVSSTGQPGKALFDFFAVHAYGRPVYGEPNPDPYTGGSFGANARAFQAVAAKYGDQGRPLWNTEVGQEADDILFGYGYSSLDPNSQRPQGLCPSTNPVVVGQFVDDKQRVQLQKCLELNARDRLYTLVTPYALFAGNNIAAACPLPGAGQPHGADRYGYGVAELMGDGSVRQRPAFTYLGSLAANTSIRGAPVRTTTVVVRTKADIGPIDNYDYYERRLVSATYELSIYGVRVDSRFPTVIHFDQNPT